VNQQEAKAPIFASGTVNAVSSATAYSNFSSVTTSNKELDITSQDYQATPIPYLSARYGRFFISGSYYSTTSFQYPTVVNTSTMTQTDYVRPFTVNNGIITPTGAPYQVQGVNTTTSNSIFNVSASRQEWDISLGYYVIPHLALTVGYKNADYNWTYQQQYITIFNSTNAFAPSGSSIASQSYNVAQNFSGPTLGLVGSLPLDYGFGLYGSYAHGFLVWDTSPVYSSSYLHNSSGADYDVAELGVTYSPNMEALSAHLPLESAAVFAGYRYQRFQWDWNDTVNNVQYKNLSNTNYGFISGVNFAF